MTDLTGNAMLARIKESEKQLKETKNTALIIFTCLVFIFACWLFK